MSGGWRSELLVLLVFNKTQKKLDWDQNVEHKHSENTEAEAHHQTHQRDKERPTYS